MSNKTKKGVIEGKYEQSVYEFPVLKSGDNVYAIDALLNVLDMHPNIKDNILIEFRVTVVEHIEDEMIVTVCKKDSHMIRSRENKVEYPITFVNADVSFPAMLEKFEGRKIRIRAETVD